MLDYGRELLQEPAMTPSRLIGIVNGISFCQLLDAPTPLPRLSPIVRPFMFRNTSVIRLS